MICTPGTLLNAAKCFECLSEKQLMAISDYLLCQIINSGTGSGSSFNGSGAPTTQVPTGTSGTYYDYTNNVNYQWNPVSNTWVLVGGGAGAPDYINYVGPPAVNPPALANIVVDSAGQQWQFYQGGWN